MRYVRETKGDRHVCSICKAKRHEKFMKRVEKYDGQPKTSRFALPIWRCADQLCGEATKNRDYHGKTSKRRRS